MCYKTLYTNAFKCNSCHFTNDQGQLSRFITKVKYFFKDEESKYVCESCMEVCHKDCSQEPDRINVGAKVRYIGNAPYECNCNDLTDCQVSRKKSNSVKYLNSDEFRNAIISHSRNNSCRSKTSRSNSHSARRMSTVSATKQSQWNYVEEKNYIFESRICIFTH